MTASGLEAGNFFRMDAKASGAVLPCFGFVNF